MRLPVCSVTQAGAVSDVTTGSPSDGAALAVPFRVVDSLRLPLPVAVALPVPGALHSGYCSTSTTVIQNLYFNCTASAKCIGSTTVPVTLAGVTRRGSLALPLALAVIT